MSSMLNNPSIYQAVDDQKIGSKYAKHVRRTLNVLVNDNKIPPSFRKHCLNLDPNLPHAYGIPKLKNRQLRPIVATYKSATTYLAKTVNRILLSQLPKQQYVFKNSYEAFAQLKKVRIKPGYKFMSFDIKSMYTAIPQKDAIDRFKDYCTKNQITLFQYGRHS